VDDEPNNARNNPPIGFKPREFLLGIGVAVAIVLSVAGSRWFVRARTIDKTSFCRATLSQIEGAKEAWVRDHQKNITQVPTWTDIVGQKAYIKDMPVCPGGGTYTLAPVGQPPRCSIPEHKLKQ